MPHTTITDIIRMVVGTLKKILKNTFQFLVNVLVKLAAVNSKYEFESSQHLQMLQEQSF